MNTSEISDQIKDWQTRLSKTARRAGKVTDEYVHDNAWTTIAFGVIIGCVIGYLLASRRD